MFSEKISKIVKSEYSEILLLWECSVRATHLFLKEEDIVFFRSEIPNYFESVELYGIKKNNAIVAFMGVSAEEIEMLFIHPAFFEKKLGSILVNYAINVLGKTKVSVNEQNKGAFIFYQKKGFKIKGYSELDATGKPYPILHLEI